jgi:dolichol-phosphate mannosyltransferase
MADSRVLSVLVPAYNEEDNLMPFYDRLNRTLNGLTDWNAEVIFIDDGSRDGSFAILQALHEKDSRVKVLRLSRNFGSWSAVLAGFRAASGDAVIWMASDLQDPPELIPRLLRSWDEGANVVWAVRAERHDPWARRIMAVLFYRLLRRIALPAYPASGTDICLMDRRVAKLFAQLKERNRFTQGLIMSLGFTQVMVPYVREQRRKGHSKFNPSRLFKIGIDMILGFSYFPLRLILYTGLLTGLATGILAIVILARLLVFKAAAAVWWWVALAVFFVGALNLVSLGIVGEYLWRVLEEARDRPQYVIRDRIGFEPGGDSPGARESVTYSRL